MTPTPLDRSPAFQKLLAHVDEIRELHLRELFSRSDRFEQFSIEAAGLLLDYSKNRITAKTRSLLLDLAEERGVPAFRDAMFAGEPVNTTEDRAVLHTALRAPRDADIRVEGTNVVPEIHGVLDRMRAFCAGVRDGSWLGYRGQAMTDVVNIGIGGSDLGPKMACRALRPYAHPRLSLHFVSNVDAHDIDAVLGRVDAATTLFIVASKTFTTQETLMNAHTARTWFLQNATEPDLPKHFVAVSTNLEAVREFGIAEANMFPMWDWVGGRYSLWSAVGLPLMLAIGAEEFGAFLSGAHAMDRHFAEAQLESNLPVLLALVGVWNRNFLGSASLSISPYHNDLTYLPAYLQQLEMESNGKRVTRDGEAVDWPTCPVLWGDVGTNGQHAYFQLLHQGTDPVPVDFIAAARPHHAHRAHHDILLANCFAQSQALMRGKTEAEVKADLRELGLSEGDVARLAPHKVFPGNRPSNTLLMAALTPAALGALIALYEHKTMVQGAIWGVNSYDQWGVELGKVLAKSVARSIHSESTGEDPVADSSTRGLLAYVDRLHRR